MANDSTHPIRLALVNDSIIEVEGLAAMLAPHSARTVQLRKPGPGRD